MIASRRHVQVKTALLEVPAVAIENRRTHQVIEAHGTTAQFRKLEANKALALVFSIIDSDQEPAFFEMPR
jgi:hypothetical protein